MGWGGSEGMVGERVACAELALILSGHGGGGGGGGELRPDTGSWVSQPQLLMVSWSPWAY